MVHKHPIKLRIIAKVISFLILIFLLGCGGGKNDSASKDGGGSSKLLRQQTLYVGGFQWGPPASFNPLAVSPSWPMTGNVNLVYEALFGYNLLDGQLKGIIGKSYTFKGKILDIILRSEAKWQNGDQLTADDVVYTFMIHKNYVTNFSYAWNYISDVKAVGPAEVSIELNEQEFNPLVVRDVIAAIPILPKKIFEKIEKDAFTQVAKETGAAPGNGDVIDRVREFKNDQKPIGSGPYTLESYSADSIVLKRVSSYWGNQFYNGKPPSPQYIVHLSFHTNDKFNSALQAGILDVSQTYFPQIWKSVDSGVGTWYLKEPYYIPGIIPALCMGLTKPPFSDVNFRHAAAYSINYDQIRTLAVYGYSPELRPGVILPFGPEKLYFSEDDCKTYGKMYDPDKARMILKKAGYTWGVDSLLIDPKGKKLRTLYVTCPKGWTDWEATVKIVVSGMRSIGIDVQEKFVDYTMWDNELKRGLFDFTMKTPQPEQAASPPWSRFEQIMSSKEIHPVGEVMYRNEGRFRDPVADKLLAAIPVTSDTVKLQQLYSDLNKLFIEKMPVIPLMYRPWFYYQFNTKHWNNFPTEANPYAPPQCLMVGAGVGALWGIVPAVEK